MSKVKSEFEKDYIVILFNDKILFMDQSEVDTYLKLNGTLCIKHISRNVPCKMKMIAEVIDDE